MMKFQQIDEPYSGHLVCQLLGCVSFEYDLYFGHSRDNLKGLDEEYNGEKILNHSLRYIVL